MRLCGVGCAFIRRGRGGNAAETGAYLVKGIAGCGNCHTARDRPMKGVELAEGNSFGGPKAPFQSNAANIKPDLGTGIGAWTNAQIKRAITNGVFHNGAKMRPPMCYCCYDKMTEADVDAVVSYLRTIKPIKNNLR